QNHLERQLFDRLEQLVLLYASFDFFSLNETEPNSMSHFCIGQSQLGQMKLTIFRYCKPTPYLARVNSGLYKRMRWNVERILYEKHQDGDCDDRQEKTDSHTDYYFLCYEDISNTHKEADRVSQDVSRDSLTRMWSIGQWVQVNPDPKTEDISDWITCEVPQANYHRLLFLGHEEPSSCIATNCLQQLLHHFHYCPLSLCGAASVLCGETANGGDSGRRGGEWRNITFRIKQVLAISLPITALQGFIDGAEARWRRQQCGLTFGVVQLLLPLDNFLLFLQLLLLHLQFKWSCSFKNLKRLFAWISKGVWLIPLSSWGRGQHRWKWWLSNSVQVIQPFILSKVILISISITLKPTLCHPFTSHFHIIVIFI
ncbi:unnamed protein product, partial [Menidia menidia]